MVEGHQGLEDIRFATEIVIDRVFDAMFQQIQDPTTFVFVLEEEEVNRDGANGRDSRRDWNCERVRRREEYERDRCRVV